MTTATRSSVSPSADSVRPPVTAYGRTTGPLSPRTHCAAGVDGAVRGRVTAFWRHRLLRPAVLAENPAAETGVSRNPVPSENRRVGDPASAANARPEGNRGPATRCGRARLTSIAIS